MALQFKKIRSHLIESRMMKPNLFESVSVYYNMDISFSDQHTLSELEVDSIIENKEKGFLVCDGKVKPLHTEWDGTYLHYPHLSEQLQHACDPKSAKEMYLGHTHELASHTPSNVDLRNLNALKEQQIQGICTVGIDGVGCYDKKRKLRFFQKLDLKPYQHRLQAEGTQMFSGTNLYCDTTQYESFCDIYDEERQQGEHIGIFTNVLVQGGNHAFQTLQSDMEVSVRPHERLTCYNKEQSEKLVCQVEEKTED